MRALTIWSAAARAVSRRRFVALPESDFSIHRVVFTGEIGSAVQNGVAKPPLPPHAKLPRRVNPIIRVDAVPPSRLLFFTQLMARLRLPQVSRSVAFRPRADRSPRRGRKGKRRTKRPRTRHCERGRGPAKLPLAREGLGRRRAQSDPRARKPAWGKVRCAFSGFEKVDERRSAMACARSRSLGRAGVRAGSDGFRTDGAERPAKGLRPRSLPLSFPPLIVLPYLES
mgnify:CR=1 FL=1